MNVEISIGSHILRTVQKAQVPFAFPVVQIGEHSKNQPLTLRGMDYKKEIGRRIKEAREAKGWTLADLSRKTGDSLAISRISHYETGLRMPGPQEAAILGKALGKRPSWIMAVDDAQLPISLQEEVLVRNWRTLPENERMSLFRQVEQLAMAYRDPMPDAKVEKHLPRTAPKVAVSRRRAEARK